MKRISSLPLRGNTRAFTLIEVALVVAIVGMMLLMILGYLFAPKKIDKLPPVEQQPLIPPSEPATPAPKKAAPTPRSATPAATATKPEPAPIATPSAPATPAATPAPTQTIDLSPQSSPVFR